MSTLWRLPDASRAGHSCDKATSPRGWRCSTRSWSRCSATRSARLLSGDIYCSVIEGCQEVYDLRRAQEWTAALTHWCEAQPDLVPYRGQCQVHRAEIMLLRGGWSDAQESRRIVRITRCPRGRRRIRPPARRYLLAELHRLRGEYGDAEEAYREAAGGAGSRSRVSRCSGLPRDSRDAAVASIRRALAEATDPARRPLSWPPRWRSCSRPETCPAPGTPPRTSCRLSPPKSGRRSWMPWPRTGRRAPSASRTGDHRPRWPPAPLVVVVAAHRGAVRGGAVPGC